MGLRSELEKHYGIQILKMARIRDVYKIATRSHGLLCLKSYEIPEEEMQFITQIFTHLLQRDFNYGPKVLLTVDHSYCLVINGAYYMLTNWVKGEHPQFTKKEHFKKGIRRLATFHSIAQGFNAPHIPADRIRYTQLKKYIKSDCNYLVDYPKLNQMMSICEEALDHVEHPSVVQGIEREQEAMAFIHGDYNYPNLMLDTTKKMHMIDFDNTSLHVRMEDFAHILHRNVAWMGKDMLRWIQYYDKYRPLSKEDLHVLYTLLLVPYPIIRALKQSKRYNRQHVMLPSNQKIKEYKHELKQML